MTPGANPFLARRRGEGPGDGHFSPPGVSVIPHNFPGISRPSRPFSFQFAPCGRWQLDWSGAKSWP